MRKLRVLKDLMPFAEENSECGLEYLERFITKEGIAILLKDKKIEWVEEPKSLEDKFEELETLSYGKNIQNLLFMELILLVQ